MIKTKLKKTNPTHHTPPHHHPEELLFTDGSSFFKQLIHDIKQAKDSILLETYIFSNDTLGQTIAQQLMEAAKRGVKVKIIVDGFGSSSWGLTYARKLEKAAVFSKIYHPFPWQIWNWSRSAINKTIFIKWIYFALNINKRNHRKICLIDACHVYIGSMNITKDHLNTHEGGENWRDYAIRISHENVKPVRDAFNTIWKQQKIKERIRTSLRNIKKNPVFRLNNTWIRRRLIHRDLLKRIDHSKQRIWITSGYFIPSQNLLNHLKKAAHHGIDVILLLTKRSDVPYMPLAASAFYIELLQSGVRIFEYDKSILHAKLMIIDDWFTLGSTNLNHRSLLHDLEIDVVLSTESSKKTIEHHFLYDLQQSKELNISNLKNHRPAIQRWLGRILLYFKYLM